MLAVRRVHQIGMLLFGACAMPTTFVRRCSMPGVTKHASEPKKATALCGMLYRLCSPEQHSVEACWPVLQHLTGCAPEQKDEQQHNGNAQQHDGGQQPLLHRAPVVRAADAELFRVKLAEANGTTKEWYAL